MDFDKLNITFDSYTPVKENIKNKEITNDAVNKKDFVKGNKNKDIKNHALLNAKISGIDNEKDEEKENIEKTFEKAVNKINENLIAAHRKLSYDVHEDTNQIIVKIIDTDTDEIVREVPPEEQLDLKAKMQDMVGLLLDKKI